ARLSGFAIKAVARLPLAPGPGLRFLAAAILALLCARVAQRPGARLPLLVRQGRQDEAGLGRRGRGGLRRRSRGGPCRAGRRASENWLGRTWRDLSRGGGRRRLPRARACRRLSQRQDSPLHLLDDNRLAAPVRKALPNCALLNGTLEMQSRLRRRGADGLVGIARFTHANS